ncbi:MAG: cellulose synthase operon protein YhjQ/BcsQ [Deferrisomatales bacterium]|nr:cellulose synthase operon protein YhjQ/BcsQ [Deferrisomatales bacterium]
MRDQAQGLRELAARARAHPRHGGGPPSTPPGEVSATVRVLALAGGRSGVGRTTLVASLAAALAGRGRAVTVIDADVGRKSLELLFPWAPSRNLGDLLRGEARPEDVVGEASPGVQLISGASVLRGVAALSRGERERLLGCAASLTEGRDIVLVDAGHGVGGGVADLCRAAAEVVLVTDADPASITGAYGLLKVLWGREPRPQARLVVNGVRTAEQGSSVHTRIDRVAARFLGRRVPCLGHVARDDHVARADGSRTPFVLAYPGCPASRCVEALASALLQTVPGTVDQGFWHRLLGGGDGGGVKG